MPAIHAHVRMVLNAAVKSTNTWELESIVAGHTSAGALCDLRRANRRVRLCPLGDGLKDKVSRRRGSARSGRRVKRWDRTQSRLVHASKKSRTGQSPKYGSTSDMACDNDRTSGSQLR